ncbi:hypothetical protein KSP40_PGU012939 [Platanthera guangdongensis]|uniref:SHSP domain-containing protein n=1 Tax=Platanthera guangdongensis TaxID=2320717 RepID=A0ABR2N4Y1_9ASPA
MAALLSARRTNSLYNALQKLLSSTARPFAASGPVASRCFSTNAQIRDSDDDRDLEIDRRPVNGTVSRRRSGGFPAHLSDVMDPFVPRTISQLLNMMDLVIDGPFPTAGRASQGVRRGWDAKEDKDALYLRIDMPGLGKEDVKVIAERGTLVIKGECEAEEGDAESRRKYSTRIDLAPELYKIDEIKAEMKNGVLKMVVPRVKEDESRDVHEVKVE